MARTGNIVSSRTADSRATSSRSPRKLRSIQRDSRHRGDTGTTHAGAQPGSNWVLRRATKVGVILGAVWLSPQTVGQSLDAAQVRMDTATSATARSDTGGPQDAVPSSLPHRPRPVRGRPPGTHGRLGGRATPSSGFIGPHPTPSAATSFARSCGHRRRPTSRHAAHLLCAAGARQASGCVSRRRVVHRARTAREQRLGR